MCGGSPEQPTPAPVAPPTLGPAPVPTLEDPMLKKVDREKRLAALRTGVAKTIKTSPKGVKASDLSTPTVVGTKTKIGQ